MIFAEPLSFVEALESRAVRSLLPTDFRTRLLSEIAPELRERAIFSAGVTNTEMLQKISDSIEAQLEGRTDRATLRLAFKDLLAERGYQPVEGEEGTLTDLSSDARLNLILDTNLEMAQGYGHWAQGQDEVALDEWPAQELIRVVDSRVPRNWPRRWADAGGQFFGGRMIALKNDPIWVKISGFALPYPPFDFNSGMDVADIDRDAAMALGVIARDTQIEPQSRGFNLDLQASPEVRDSALKEALLDNVGSFAEFIGGVLRYRLAA